MISMRLDDELDHDAIAAKLGITVPAARQRDSRAVRRVAEARALLTRMNEHGINGLEQDVIALPVAGRRFRGDRESVQASPRACRAVDQAGGRGPRPVTKG